jgi:hypothetical protein
MRRGVRVKGCCSTIPPAPRVPLSAGIWPATEPASLKLTSSGLLSASQRSSASVSYPRASPVSERELGDPTRLTVASRHPRFLRRHQLRRMLAGGLGGLGDVRVDSSGRCGSWASGAWRRPTLFSHIICRSTTGASASARRQRQIFTGPPPPAGSWTGCSASKPSAPSETTSLSRITRRSTNSRRQPGRGRRRSRSGSTARCTSRTRDRRSGITRSLPGNPQRPPRAPVRSAPPNAGALPRITRGGRGDCSPNTAPRTSQLLCPRIGHFYFGRQRTFLFWVDISWRGRLTCFHMA